VAWDLPMPKKDHLRESFCSGFVISGVTHQSTLAGAKRCSAPVASCPALSLSFTSDPEWSKHLRSPVLQPSLSTSLSLAGKNSPWALYHTNSHCSGPQDSSSSVTTTAFNFQSNSVLGKKQSQPPWPLPAAACLQHPTLEQPLC